eukprot:5723645-Pyramimonas_sp.AAC.1
MLWYSAVLVLGAVPGALDEEKSDSFLSMPRRVEEASVDDPSSVGVQPVLCLAKRRAATWYRALRSRSAGALKCSYCGGNCWASGSTPVSRLPRRSLLLAISR